jgi:hypothetical protein
MVIHGDFLFLFGRLRETKDEIEEDVKGLGIYMHKLLDNLLDNTRLKKSEVSMLAVHSTATYALLTQWRIS